MRKGNPFTKKISKAKEMSFSNFSKIPRHFHDVGDDWSRLLPDGFAFQFRNVLAPNSNGVLEVLGFDLAILNRTGLQSPN